MAIPKYNELYSNVLSLFSNETEEYKTRYVKKIVADLLDLPPEERNLLKGDTTEPLVEYNLGWTLTYLKKAGLLESKRRGYINITKLGLSEIKENPNITEKDLYKFPAFVEFKRGSNKLNHDSNQTKLKDKNEVANPFNQLNISINQINSKVVNDLLEVILNSDIDVFNKLVQDLLIKLNYHGVKLTFDSNIINGLIFQDSLGLEKIAIHAVNKPEEIKISALQQFAGSIVSKGMTKGIFITSSSFNESIHEYLNNQHNLNIILIDGKKLAELMIENEIGTVTTHIYKINEVNKDYFNIK